MITVHWLLVLILALGTAGFGSLILVILHDVVSSRPDRKTRKKYGGK